MDINYDVLFLNAVSMLADKYKIEIDWENSDLEKHILNFNADPEEERTINFLSELTEVFKDRICD
jgi:hypothetical protein